jgi:hypothetical protein
MDSKPVFSEGLSMIQAKAERIGRWGCYFLSILRAAEIETCRMIDVIRAYDEMVSALVMRDNCFILDPGAIMTLLTSKQYRGRHDRADYRPKDNEYLIQRYELETAPMTVQAHFVLADKEGRVMYDPLGTSRTVKEGRLVSTRVLERVEQ